jgi:hypothetical protein
MFVPWLRTTLKPVFETSALSPSEVADAIADWVRDRRDREVAVQSQWILVR